eukprot:gene28290-37441_t
MPRAAAASARCGACGRPGSDQAPSRYAAEQGAALIRVQAYGPHAGVARYCCGAGCAFDVCDLCAAARAGRGAADGAEWSGAADGAAAAGASAPVALLYSAAMGRLLKGGAQAPAGAAP